MAQQRSFKNLALIKDLCNRLGFTLSSDQLWGESGLRSLMPQIQERLRQLQDQDTYGDVEDIPTDTCPVLFAGLPLPQENDEEYVEDILGSNLDSIAESMLETQLQLSLVARALSAIDTLKEVRTNNRSSFASSGCVEASLNPLLTEIRSEMLLKEVMLSVVRAASEASGAARSVGHRSCISQSCVSLAPSGASDSPHASKTSRKIRSAPAEFATSSAPPQARTLSTSHTSVSSASFVSDSTNANSNSTSSSQRRSAFCGFPCYPDGRTGPSKRQGQLSSSNCTTVESKTPQPPVSASASSSVGSRNRGNLGSSWATNDRDSPSTVGSTRQRLPWHRANDHQLRLLPSLPNMHVDGLPDYQPSEELISFHNIEARWRGRSVRQRRQEYCWSVEDAYLTPFDGWDAVARDGWQFAGKRGGLCPDYAQLNRKHREELVASRRRIEDPVQLNRGDSSPLLLNNGVTNPLGPFIAPCRTAYVGK